MKVSKLTIPDVLLIEPTIYNDKRGYFFESFNKKEFEKKIGFDLNFVQDNQSYSVENVLRGLHYQVYPMEQDKLVGVAHGKVFDVAVDIRRSSPTYGQWVGEVLSSENKKQLWIPKGFAHGFLTLSNDTSLCYKVTNYYSKSCERSIVWNDPNININWNFTHKPILSEKDEVAKILQEI
jgi:dTDP-4-dehydrorhamnose 3,5-epimerase